MTQTTEPTTQATAGLSPEPWFVGVSLDNGWPCYRLRDMRDKYDAKEIEANRRAIEAVPELLAALKGIRDAVVRNGRLVGWNSSDLDYLNEALKKAEAQ